MKDLVDRKTAINALLSAYPLMQKEKLTEVVNGIPPAQQERKKGKWIPHESVFGGSKEMVYTCGQCGHNIGFHMENYCPSCGADMRGDKSEID